MKTFVLAVFCTVYLGMILGGLPYLRVDRTGIALLGAIALVASEIVGVDEAWRAVHIPTLTLLFSFMVIAAQLRMGGFYAAVTRRVGTLDVSPAALLAVVMAISAAMSAVFTNDVVCLATAPVLAAICRERRLDPVPYLIGLACAANIGSAATLIGNPQNILIGETLRLSFADFLATAWVPVVLSLAAAWGVVVAANRRRWHDGALSDSASNPSGLPVASVEPELDCWQSAKGLAVAIALFAGFVFSPWPRDLMALAGAGLLLTSRTLHSERVLGHVDWQLLILFIGLFVVNHAVQRTGLADAAVADLARAGIGLSSIPVLATAAFVLSSVVSNVPAVMLLLPSAHDHAAGVALALSSTLSGNLLIVGSVANIIVVDAAARAGIAIDWRRHARIGIPVTLVTLAVAAAWLGFRRGGA